MSGHEKVQCSLLNRKLNLGDRVRLRVGREGDVLPHLPFLRVVVFPPQEVHSQNHQGTSGNEENAAEPCVCVGIISVKVFCFPFPKTGKVQEN